MFFSAALIGIIMWYIYWDMCFFRLGEQPIALWRATNRGWGIETLFDGQQKKVSDAGSSREIEVAIVRLVDVPNVIGRRGAIPATREQ